MWSWSKRQCHAQEGFRQAQLLYANTNFCNTLGVYHQLRSGFELKHDILSGDKDVKVKPMEISPNLNLDMAPLLTYRPI
jgi:hypothetical protein